MKCSTYTCPKCGQITTIMQKMTASDFDSFKCSCEKTKEKRFDGESKSFYCSEFSISGMTGNYYEITATSKEHAKLYAKHISLSYQECLGFDDNLDSSRYKYRGSCIGRFVAPRIIKN